MSPSDCSLDTVSPCSSSTTSDTSSGPSAATPASFAASCPRAVTETGASGSRVRLLIRGSQPLDRDVGVDLRGGERSVTQNLLNRPEVGAPLEEVGGRGVAQAVRSHVGGVRDVRHEAVHRLANLPLVRPATAPA